MSESAGGRREEHEVVFTRGDEEWRARAMTGEGLFAVARAAGAPVETLCHGMGACVRCKLVVREGTLTPPTPLERDRLGNIFHLTGERLCCQARVVGPVALELPRPRVKRGAPTGGLAGGR
jgi:ferredoxin, 2Fe-2S